MSLWGKSKKNMQGLVGLFIFYLALGYQINSMRKVSILGLMSIFSLSILFHLLVIIGIVPSHIVWGGRATNADELIQLEIVSISLNTLFLVFILILNGNIKVRIKPLLAKILLWLMSILFILNTIGNLLAKSSIEKIIFTPVTLLSSVFCLYLALRFLYSKG
jgi:hypothetical protein